MVHAWGHLWCRARLLDAAGEQLAIELAADVLRRAAKPLTRGSRLHVWDMTGPGGWYARLFAGVYVVILVFVDALDLHATRTAVPEALPRIESLTVSLPPHDAARTTSGAAKRRAGPNDDLDRVPSGAARTSGRCGAREHRRGARATALAAAMGAVLQPIVVGIALWKRPARCAARCADKGFILPPAR